MPNTKDPLSHVDTLHIARRVPNLLQTVRVIGRRRFWWQSVGCLRGRRARETVLPTQAGPALTHLTNTGSSSCQIGGSTGLKQQIVVVVVTVAEPRNLAALMVALSTVADLAFVTAAPEKSSGTRELTRQMQRVRE